MKFELPPISENARNQIAQQYAYHFVNEVLPLLSGMDEREKYSAIKFETNRMLEGYDSWLAHACNRFEKIAKDALDCSVKPIIFSVAAPENGGKDK